MTLNATRALSQRKIKPIPLVPFPCYCEETSRRQFSEVCTLQKFSRVHWLVSIVNKQADARIYDLCDADATNENGEFEDNMDDKEKNFSGFWWPVNEFLNRVEQECYDTKLLVASDLIKFKFLVFLSRVLTSFCPFWLFVIVQNKLKSVFHAPVLLLTMNFITTLSK